MTMKKFKFKFKIEYYIEEEVEHEDEAEAFAIADERSHYKNLRSKYDSCGILELTDTTIEVLENE